MGALIDLHLHSTCSDGTLSPTELVRMAAGRGLKTIALADHDSVDGIDDALAEGIYENVEVIPAVELSVAFHEYQDVHLLGYGIDHRDRVFLSMLAAFRTRRDTRGREIINRINEKLAAENRTRITLDEVLAGAAGTLGRPHIARVLVAHGHAATTQDAFLRYLIPCDVPKQYIPMREALDELHRIGGVAVLAHPTSITADRHSLSLLIKELAATGLDGIEAYNNLCTAEESQYLERVSYDLGLVTTGGSDFHGFENDIQMGVGHGSLVIPYRCIEQLKALKNFRTPPTRALHVDNKKGP